MPDGAKTLPVARVAPNCPVLDELADGLGLAHARERIRAAPCVPGRALVSPAVPDRYAAFSSLDFDRPADAVLRITLSTPGKLNAVGEEMHGQLAAVWPAVSADPDTRAVIVRGAGGVFSAGGDLDLVAEIASDFDTRIACLQRGTRPRLQHRQLHEADRLRDPRPVRRRRPRRSALLADISIATPSARIIDGHTRLGVAAGDHAVIIWPLLCGMAKAKYHLLLCEPLDGAEAERIGLVSLCVADDEIEAKHARDRAAPGGRLGRRDRARRSSR